MNIKRYHWGLEADKFGPTAPRVYRYIFRHVVDVFRRAGASRVVWVFCPNAESQPLSQEAAWNSIRNYYPGDEYVDILGIDGYNWGTTQKQASHGWDSHWLSFEEVFKQGYTELRAISPDKPLIVF